MRNRITTVRRFGLVIVAAFLTLAAAHATPQEPAVTVSGNRHVDAAMIRAHVHADSEGRVDAAALDAAVKSLYATGLFEDVRIARNGERITVTVVENRTIGRVAFEGNKKIKDEELQKIVRSKPHGPLSRPQVHDDVDSIAELYHQHGYFDAHVEPKTIAAPHERVALVFEIKENEKLAVKQILFEGNAAFAANRLKGVIKTGETNFLSFLLDNDTYNAERLDADRDLIRRFYRARGFADVTVDRSANYRGAKDGVAVTFKIAEGAQYRFGAVDIRSHVATDDAAALRHFLRVKTGDVYDADAIDRTAADMTIALAGQGKPFATVLAQSEKLTKARRVNLVFAVQEGIHRYVERIEIRGNTKTGDAVIRRELDFGEGDAYNQALIDRGERRLKALGYFKSVKITTQPGSAPDRIVLDLTVEEQGTGDFSVSGGYSSSDGFLAQVSIGDRDFLGTGDSVKASVSYGQYARSVDLAFTEPYLLGQRLSLGVDLFGKETMASSYQSFDSTVYGAKLVLGTPLSDQLTAQWSYSIYNQGLTLDPTVGTASLPIQQAASAGPIWVSSVGTGLVYSTLDNAKNPTSGVRAQVGNEVAGLGGAAKFGRTTQDVRYYHPVVGDVVGMVRAQGGYVTPWGGQQLPLLDGFFGGPQLVRGFAPNGFGPRDLTPGTTQDNLGGNVYWATSAELQAPMPLVSAAAQLKVALFADAGSLWATNASSVSTLASSLSPSQQIANSRAIRSSVGAGLVWDSMFGPIRVDYAYPIARQSYDVTQRLSFSAGAF